MPLSLRLAPDRQLTPQQPPQRLTPAPTAAPGDAVPPSSVDSHDILRGERAVAINHNGLTYRLQATRLGKLILTK